ncbi:MAG: nickel-dependent lactate racemase [Sphaerochaetaceae bacterium]|nr:nickel-dependent lactate racemase [Sphaerochaetaceae bacterium]
MKRLLIPYGKTTLSLQLEDSRLHGVLVPKLHDYVPDKSQEQLVDNALANPIGSPRLSELSKGKRNVVLIASDHTRPVPSKIIVPRMLAEIRKGNPDARITILIATGCHRGTTKQEIEEKFGTFIARHEHIIVHDCDSSSMAHVGVLPSGGDLLVNRIVVDADLVCSEGFIEPHFFAGFSGGRKSVLPGIASRKSVLSNHCSEFIADEHARTGVLDGNPIHKDMVWAARKAKLAFICNVVLDAKKEIIYAVAGDMEEAHLRGCAFLSSLCKVSAKPADIVISSNGGYPLDQNIYQAVKGMTAAEATVRRGGVIIMVAQSQDGHGGEHFFHQLSDERDIDKTLKLFLSRGRNETLPDQWQAQIFIRILQKASVIYVSDAPDAMVKALHMVPCHSLETAMAEAQRILGNPKASVTVIPDGVSVIVLPE